MSSFRAIYLEQTRDGETSASLRDLAGDAVPDPDDDALSVRVAYSTINYKDGLAITGRSPVVRRFPMVPGIDLAGTIVESRLPGWREGDDVVVNGWGIGETHWGGLAQQARMRPEWLFPKPATMTLRETMAIGTAGYTAALAVLALQRQGVAPPQGEVLVTGATGGVGSIAVMLLAASGYRVVASTGKPAEAGYLTRLGAAEVIDRDTLSAPGRPLQRERWAGAIDSVGSHTLANVCASTRAGGAVAACGLAQGMDFPGTVAPFILRGITLAGINSVATPIDERRRAWALLESLVDRPTLHELSRTIPLAGAIPAASDILAGAVTGRIVVDVNAS
jgi:acrylyl-CoA reductase (NADPH)